MLNAPPSHPHGPTSVRRVTPDEKGPGPTESDSGRGWFLPSSGWGLTEWRVVQGDFLARASSPATRRRRFMSHVRLVSNPELPRTSVRSR